MSKPIVVGIDGGPGNDIALHWAIAEAAQRSVPLMVLHADEEWSTSVVRTGSVLEATSKSARKLVDDAVAVVQAMNRDIHVSSVISPNHPADALISWATDASMLVLGNRGRSALSAAVRGSVGASVVAQARCPVIIARTMPPRSAPVVVGVDGSPASKAAVAFAFGYAAQHMSGVRAVHVWHRSVLPGAGDLPAQRRAHLRVVTETLADAQQRHPNVPAWTVSTIGNAHEFLAEESMRAQLVVVGTHGRGARSGMLLGSVSQALLRNASSPLAVIP
nr:universal stress protein [Kibdelosporangium sp. MJ126-NF4]CEL19745.1 Universal stress protein family [Kibdelosporangium sp. MJ126-NF4]CTQ96970.1 Universal stress protein family [Kibdelosporangium sp. MJ126-NF4]